VEVAVEEIASLRLKPAFVEHVAQLLQESGESPFVANRLLKLPEPAKLTALIILDSDPHADVRESLADLEERGR
jgi:hypothetical protein